MARPKKQIHEKRSAQIPPIRVTDAEFAHLQEQASIASCTVSSYVRDKALLGRVEIPQSKIDADMLIAVNRVGRSVNMIAKSLNQGRGTPFDFDKIMQELSDVLGKVATAYDG